MKKQWMMIAAVLIMAQALGFGFRYEDGTISSIGGVTLFDQKSPFAGLNNPGLLDEYDRLPVQKNQLIIMPQIAIPSGFMDEDDFQPDIVSMATDPHAFEAKYGFGSLYLMNVNTFFSVSKDTAGNFNTLINTMQGTMPGATGSILGLGFSVELLKALTFGGVNLSPLFVSNTASESQKISNALLILQQNKIAALLEYNINILSYYRNNIGFSFYSSGSLRAGFYGEGRSLIVLKDPAIDLKMETGLAVTFGIGSYELPFIGKINLDTTVRAILAIEGQSASMDDAMELIDMIQVYQAKSVSNVFNFTMFGDGRIARGGLGISMDMGFVKKIDDTLSIAAKLSDLISPRYWLTTGSTNKVTYDINGTQIVTKSGGFGWGSLPNLSIGVKYTFQIPEELKWLINQPSMYLQMDDLFYTEQLSLLAKLHMGADCNFLFDFLRLGVGINQGYPTLGASVNISLKHLTRIPYADILFYILAPVTYLNVRLDFSAYGKEIGSYPGQFGFVGYNVNFQIYWSGM